MRCEPIDCRDLAGTSCVGRLVSRQSGEGGTTYTWDATGHLGGLESLEASATYEYGVSGVRERKTVVSAEGTTTIESLFDGQELVAERDSGGRIYRYLTGPAGEPLQLNITEPSGQVRRYAYQLDGLGNVIALTDASGAVAATYRYDPYGRILEVGGACPTSRKHELMR